MRPALKNALWLLLALLIATGAVAVRRHVFNAQRALTPDGAAHGALDPGQANGMSPAECARQVIDGVEKGLEEILIGGREKYAVFLKRWAPKILSRILRGRNVD